MPLVPSVEPMQIDAEDGNENMGEFRTPQAQDPLAGGGGGGGAPQPPLAMVENPTLDLETYVQGYSGLARLSRLMFVAQHCPCLRLEALKLALQYVMSTYNTQMYAQIHRKLVEAHNALSGPGSDSGPNANLPDLAAGSSALEKIPPLDQVWMDQKAKKAALKLEKLDTDLKNYKSNSIKESIRRGHDDLGDHFLDCGDLSHALKCYSRARDYCTSGRHVIQMCLNVIKVSIYLRNWSHVISYVNKAMSTPEFSEGTMKGVDSASIATRLHCAYGLAELANAKMWERTERQVISSSSFKLFLELDPQLREIIFNFYESKYGKCLKLLEECKPNLMLDIYLAFHVSTLYTMIRNRGLVQYFSPFLCADLKLMASCFNTTLLDLEDELMTLILDGQIQARIDSHNKALYAQDVDQRNATFEKAIEMGQMYERRAQLLVFRSALLKNNVIVKTNSRSSNNEQGDPVVN
ncbi:hypothetical protein TCAL_02257 [Tigriopus californicus]|uniref:PCI domain-containing protein n=1 Tax=Tigriopus californicus TaxID=6832 RepID=A0A553PQJ4_TIGCA|nr:hypothetical protein TCAL_02257 [Tigriopus californicus]|eukprot:TCALIF_02257-PA protein Name:"Similar to Gps1 COP9 signalosome complex subunit 1 (Mus musculus)" AED:0.08 eAED:0.08 QI:223/0.71/0.62/1/1/1/8/109/464